jgi:hypothetical protein
MIQSPNWPVRRHMARTSPSSSSPYTGPTRPATSPPKRARTDSDMFW